ncbi:WD40 repeat-like protein [Amylostereum chailletii]|nr:WD40 repeat-like protein [Amylostereum chailletii]
MESSNVAVNYVHPEGQTAFAFSRDGAYCYTGGSDNLARIFISSEGDDQEPTTVLDADLPITTLTAGNNTWYTGSGDGDVRMYKLGDREFEATVLNVPGAWIRCIAVDPAGKRIAVSSDELSVKIVDLEDVTKVLVLDGYKDCVRRVTWDPSGSLVTTSGADGGVFVWDVTQEEPRKVKSIEGIIPAVKDKASREFVYDCSAVWHPGGQYFVVATRTHEIVSISRDSWAKVSTYQDQASIGSITALAMSPNGVYLASACNKEVHVWSTETRRLMFKFPHPLPHPVTQLGFSPTENTLAITDYNGAFHRWMEVIPSASPHPVKPTTTSLTRVVHRKPSLSLFDDDENDILGQVDNAMDNEVDLDNLDEPDPIDWITDDVSEAGHEEARGYVKEMVSVTKAQPAFQPSSTPMENKKRYLAYNMIGVIEVTDQDTHHIVNVEFHDHSARKAYHFTDHFKYNLASLGERGALYACQPENEHPAHVMRWTYELDEGVKVLGVAAGGPPPTKSLRIMSDGDMRGNGNVVIATSEHELTFLTGTGIERCSIALDGDFVSMVAGPEWVFVIQRDGSTTLDGSQNLSGTLYDFEDLCVLQTRKLPVRKGHTLKWIGISQEGAPAIYDSAGVVYIMPRFRIPLRGTWVRVLDTNKLERKQGKDESYWPVDISQDAFMCLILKGRQEHPSFPRPLIQELEVRLPFRRKDPKEGPLEERLARECMNLHVQRDALGDEDLPSDLLRREVALDKELIQLIQNACKNDKLPRALDLTRMLHHTTSFDAAMKVAQFYHLVGLQEKMQTLKEDREDRDVNAESREKRRRWARDYDPVPPARMPPAEVNGSRIKPFQDFGPPPTVHRPGLTRAAPRSTPVPEPNDYDYQMNEDVDILPPPPNHADAKRKREEDHVAFRETTSPDGTKRRALGESSAAFPKPKANPFANKSATAQNRNPFARPVEHSKSLHKSESFFDKAEAAETGRPKGVKGKAATVNGKKDVGPRQTTLFGLPQPAAAPEKVEKRGRPKRKADDSQPSSGGTSKSVTPARDVVAVADRADIKVDTQTRSQTATIVDSQTKETQVIVEGDDEPIDWPESPQAETTNLAVEG